MSVYQVVISPYKNGEQPSHKGLSRIPQDVPWWSPALVDPIWIVDNVEIKRIQLHRARWRRPFRLFDSAGTICSHMAKIDAIVNAIADSLLL
jgi:hypothetical protein